MPDKVAVVVDASGGATPSTTTFGELNEQVNRLGNGLLAAGAQSGERLVWCGPNSLEVITTIHAARKCNLVAVPLSYRFNAEEMQYVIDNSDATVVVVDAEEAPLVASVRDQLPKLRAVVVFGGAVPEGSGFLAWDDVCAGQSTAEPDVAATSEAGAAMIYTSGTTGKPKGALRTRTDRQIVFALLDAAAPAARELRAPHDRAAVPLGSARVRVDGAHASARPSSCCASSIRCAGSRS